jgi:hypothetical protein
MNKHTPGPWHIEREDSPDAEWSRRFPTIIADEYEVVGNEGFYGDLETDMANARLIAAAPDLLEALEFVIRGVPDTWEGVQKARAAIAKATGENA